MTTGDSFSTFGSVTARAVPHCPSPWKIRTSGAPSTSPKSRPRTADCSRQSSKPWARRVAIFLLQSPPAPFSSDGPICRICHEGGNGEGLLSPCDCTGTLGTVHKSCLEKWLSSSNTSYCELCHTEFVVERRPRPLTEDHMQFNSHLEAIGLIALTIALFTIYVLWTLVSFRYHCQLYSEWRRTNQKVRLMIPDARNPSPVPHSLLSAKLLKKKADETTV
ncbi:hypothetical protein E2320_022294 [Naja naja]|nr:hypothetical protein E2320_022294 [Naja naja]